METANSHELDLASVRFRARRLRRPDLARPAHHRAWFGQRGRLDRLAVGCTIGLLLDLVALGVLAASGEVSIVFVLLVGPMTVLFYSPALMGATVAGIFLAGVTGHWRIAVGLLLFQVLAVAVGFGWMMAVGVGGIPF